MSNDLNMYAVYSKVTGIRISTVYDTMEEAEAHIDNFSIHMNKYDYEARLVTDDPSYYVKNKQACALEKAMCFKIPCIAKAIILSIFVASIFLVGIVKVFIFLTGLLGIAFIVFIVALGMIVDV